MKGEHKVEFFGQGCVCNSAPHGGSIYKEAQNNKHSGPWQAKLRQKSEPWFVYLASLNISFMKANLCDSMKNSIWFHNKRWHLGNEACMQRLRHQNQGDGAFYFDKEDKIHWQNQNPNIILSRCSINNIWGKLW